MKKSKRLKLIIQSCLLIICCIGLFQCYESVEGCLDIQATNFDVEADKNCCDNEEDCCCSYPQLKLAVIHRMDSLNYNAPYTLGNNTIDLLNFRFYLSDFNILIDNQWIGVEDSIALQVLLDGMSIDTTVEDNFALFAVNQVNYTIGTIRTTGDIDSIRFVVGVGDPANYADPALLSSGHPLAIQSDSMHWNQDDGYIFNNIEIVGDTLTKDTLRLQIGQAIGSLSERIVRLPLQKKVVSGFDISISLKINYAEWFSGIDFVVENEVPVKEKIVKNTANAFSITD